MQTRLFNLALTLIVGFFLSGCANDLQSRNRVDMSAQPPRYEAPYDQIPQPASEQYALNYSATTLSNTENQRPEPIELYPENYRTENQNPEIREQISRPLEAIPAPNKPGFVISPYAPNAGLVDIREFNPGMEVRDPYSGRVMLVPTETQSKPSDPVIDKERNKESTGSPFLQPAPPTSPAPTGRIIQQGPPVTVQQ